MKQEEIYWMDLGEPKVSEPRYRHPHIVIQNNIFNQSKINTVVVCSLTSNLQRAFIPGNVILKKGEANIPKKSVVNITQIFTVNKKDLLEKIGTLSKSKFSEVLDGVRLLLEPKDIK